MGVKADNVPPSCFNIGALFRNGLIVRVSTLESPWTEGTMEPYRFWAGFLGQQSKNWWLSMLE